MQLPDTIDRTPDPNRPLSEVFDTHGHRILRYPNNRLMITSTSTGREVAPSTAETVAAWYWRHVGVKE